MMWKITDSVAVPIDPSYIETSSVGSITVYKSGNDILLETNDMMKFGMFNKKFHQEVMPKIRKKLGIAQPLDIDKLKGRISQQHESRRRETTDSDDTERSGGGES